MNPIAFLTPLLLIASVAEAQRVRRASIGDSGIEPNGHSLDPALSADGRTIVFRSTSSNMVDGDFNQAHDLFARDLVTGVVECISVDRNGIPSGYYSAGANSTTPVSADGRYVAFVSSAQLMVPGLEGGGSIQVYVRDRSTSSSVRVSRDTTGQLANAGCDSTVGLSDSGRFVVFGSTATNLSTPARLVIHDRDADMDGVFDEDQHGSVSWAPAAVTASGWPLTGAHGFHTAIEVTDDGRFILFAMTSAGSYYQIYLTDRDLDGDGLVGEPGDVTTSLLISEPGHMVIGNATPDMRFIAYGGPLQVGGSYVPKIFDRWTGASIVLSTIGSAFPELSGEGRYVAFATTAALQANDRNGEYDVYRLDRDPDMDGIFDEPGQTMYRCMSVSSQGQPGTGSHWLERQPISADGTRVAFPTPANLVPEETSFDSDVFAADALDQSVRPRFR